MREQIKKQILHNLLTEVTKRYDHVMAENTRIFEKISYEATHDELTGLYNRSYFIKELKKIFYQSRKQGSVSAILFIDLDNFKVINDTVGHQFGDILLKQIAGKMRETVSEDQMLARFGGDEFVLLLKHIGVDEPEAQRHIEQVAGRLLETINYTYSIHQKIYQVTASIGIAVFGNDAIDDVNDILRHADSAMYEAKRQGKACHVFFTPVIESRLQRKLHMETALRKSLEKKEFTLMFQKQVDFRGKIVGVEALIRWNHPTEGEISPHEFIPLAEETGLILPIGEWVLDRACHVLSQWQAQPQFASLKLSINCSAIEFMQEDYAQKVIDTVEAYGVDPERLTLEITESLLMTDNETLLETMNQLNDFGITLAIDDFGTGYSSLAYIKKFPIGILKIDQSFLEDIVDEPSDQTLVKAIISVAKDFNMSIIAEGVETREQIEVLRALGGDEIIGQGYFYGKPVPLEVFEKTLLNGTSKTV